MKREEVMVQLTLVFREIFDDDNIVLTDSTSANDIEDWDSLEQINIIASCEKKFDMHFDMKEISKLNNVGEMVDLICAKINAD